MGKELDLTMDAIIKAAERVLKEIDYCMMQRLNCEKVTLGELLVLADELRDALKAPRQVPPPST